ncbi:hypothetical protein V6N12_036190 [Hibiscus sabdariffa]|uniref:Uncharacterized protein n=1 Tax=Hibiscus sabdariffa TaxID=183260 RepID=A0ABR2EPX5_9ROSI
MCGEVVVAESSGIDGNAVTLSRDVVDEAVNVLVEVGTGVASSVLSQDPVLVVDKVLPRDNPFSILAEGQSSEASPRKSREAADGVPELMNQLKPKGKGGGGANKKRVAARQSFNTVKVLHDMQGQKHDTFEGISAEFVRHFSEALGSFGGPSHS